MTGRHWPKSSEGGEQSDGGLSRRTFVRTTGLLAGLGVVGVGPGAAASGLDDAFRNWRAWEASKVWERGYRGRPDRTVALTDSGIEARHPDVGPWNGVRVEIDDDGPRLVGGDPFADAGSGADAAKTVDWYDAGDGWVDVAGTSDANVVEGQETTF